MIKKTLFLLSQFVDDVEFWFPPGKKSIVEYRSASRVGNYDFDINRKRIKVSILSTLVLFLSLHSHHLCDKQMVSLLIDLSVGHHRHCGSSWKRKDGVLKTAFEGTLLKL